MNKQDRPISPHLTIYKPQITSLLSITHRITGIIQSVGLFIIFSFFIIMLFERDIVKLAETLIQSPLGKIFFFFYTLSLLYHTLNGVRHLIWDLGYGFDIKNVTYSGYAIIFLSISINIILWSI